MVRTSTTIAVTIACAIATACTHDPAVLETTIDFLLPIGDRDVAENLMRIELEIWPATSDACPLLSGWRRDVCGESCTEPRSPRDRGEVPEGVAEMTRDPGGVWSALRLPVSGAGAWQVIARGYEANAGEAFVYGCRAVSSEQTWSIVLWRPWCDDEGLNGLLARCKRQLHPACEPKIDCDAIPTEDDPSAISSPVCSSVNEFEDPWEEKGVACVGERPQGACRAALVVCEAGRREPEVDGVCPRHDLEEMCDATIEQDYNCDLRIPGPCLQETCTASMSEKLCGSTDERCSGVQTCIPPDGEWSDCIFAPSAEPELCDGFNNDCDIFVDDATDRDAIAACNAGHEREPIADSCVGGRCQCGARDLCRGTMCRGGECVALPEPTDGGVKPIEEDAQVFPDAEDADIAASMDAAVRDTGRRDGG